MSDWQVLNDSIAESLNGSAPVAVPSKRVAVSVDECSVLEATDDVEGAKRGAAEIIGSSNSSTRDKMENVERLYREDKLLEAARILRSVVEEDASLLSCEGSGVPSDILSTAKECEEMVANLKSDLDGEPWTKQGQTATAARPTTIHYKFDKETGTKLTARLETPIETSLLIPLLSVLNETELYPTWLPNWTVPRLRVKSSTKLQQIGRASQIIAIQADMPWPMKPRELILSALAFDDIDTNCEIAIRLKNLNTGDRNGLIPPPTHGCQRVDFEGGFLIRPCPSDRIPSTPPVNKSTPQTIHTEQQHVEEENNNNERREAAREEMILVSFLIYVDAKMTLVPQSFINFVIRTVMGRMWTMFLKVAEDVRDGTLIGHANAIQQKRNSLYDWADIRVKAMFDMLRN